MNREIHTGYIERDKLYIYLYIQYIYTVERALWVNGDRYSLGLYPERELWDTEIYVYSSRSNDSLTGNFCKIFTANTEVVVV